MCRGKSKKISVLAAIAAFAYLSATAAATGPLPANDAALHLQGVSEELAAGITDKAEELEKLVEWKDDVKRAFFGFATYYASRFVGRKTSSGERYHPDKLTAAHHNLPLGSLVMVINPANNLEVKVTINDRCAPKSYHLIDLSRAAAKKIGILGREMSKVVIIPVKENALSM